MLRQFKLVVENIEVIETTLAVDGIAFIKFESFLSNPYTIVILLIFFHAITPSCYPESLQARGADRRTPEKSTT